MNQTAWQLETPVAFLVFNRPELTARVFERIRQAKPSTLLLIADGPRPNKPDDIEKCQKVRQIVEAVDWDCQVFKNYSETNLGCKKRVSSGLDWVFENFEQSIILEDDCLPDISFFRFCEELLQYYCNDERIMLISGSNFCPDVYRTQYSYCFSRYTNTWGWATWRRAWRYYNLEMNLWKQVFQENWLDQIFADKRTVRYWQDIFWQVYNNKIDTWDYQWAFACWIQSGLSIVPEVNLICNIGFTSDATHTIPIPGVKYKTSNLPTQSVAFPLRHPPFIIPNRRADNYFQKKFINLTFCKRIGKILKPIVLSLYSWWSRNLY